jgi:hypothetical protein
MKNINWFILLSLIACSSQNSYEKKFSGNKFQVQVVMDTSLAGQEIIAGMLASMDIKMDFKEDGKMIYTASMGAISGGENVTQWKVLNDSLFTTNSEGKKEGYKISKVTQDQIYLTSDSVNLTLKKIP